MINGFFVLVLAFVIVAGPPIYRRARRLDRLDAYHLMHGPTSGCVECEGP